MRVEYNKIRDVCKETADRRAFYMDLDVTSRANIVRNNWFENIVNTVSLGTVTAFAAYILTTLPPERLSPIMFF